MMTPPKECVRTSLVRPVLLEVLAFSLLALSFNLQQVELEPRTSEDGATGRESNKAVLCC